MEDSKDFKQIDEHRIDGVLDVEREQVFCLRGLVAVLRDAVYRFDENTELRFENPVPVRDDTDAVIGFAVLSFAGSELWAEIKLVYSTPERLSVQVGSQPYYLLPVGALQTETYLIESFGVLELRGVKVLVQRLEISSIKITPEKPADDRILPVEIVP